MPAKRFKFAIDMCQHSVLPLFNEIICKLHLLFARSLANCSPSCPVSNVRSQPRCDAAMAACLCSAYLWRLTRPFVLTLRCRPSHIAEPGAHSPHIRTTIDIFTMLPIGCDARFKCSRFDVWSSRRMQICMPRVRIMDGK